MTTKSLILQKCEKFSKEGSFQSRVCKLLKEGEFSDVLSPQELTHALNEGPGTKIKVSELTARMEPLLTKDIVKAKLTGKGKNKMKFWFPGWINKKQVESKLVGQISGTKPIFSENVIKRLGPRFKTEIEDIKLVYGKSGDCTAFLLRKILEKLVFLAFAKNGVSERLKDNNGDYVGLKKKLDLCKTNKVKGEPYLMPKTAEKISGIKFLGDTSAHDPITNVEMEEIIPQLPYITTAYKQLLAKLE